MQFISLYAFQGKFSALIVCVFLHLFITLRYSVYSMWIKIMICQHHEWVIDISYLTKYLLLTKCIRTNFNDRNLNHNSKLVYATLGLMIG